MIPARMLMKCRHSIPLIEQCANKLSRDTTSNHLTQPSVHYASHCYELCQAWLELSPSFLFLFLKLFSSLVFFPFELLRDFRSVFLAVADGFPAVAHPARRSFLRRPSAPTRCLGFALRARRNSHPSARPDRRAGRQRWRPYVFTPLAALSMRRCFRRNSAVWCNASRTAGTWLIALSKP